MNKPFFTNELTGQVVLTNGQAVICLLAVVLIFAIAAVWVYGIKKEAGFKSSNQ